MSRRQARAWAAPERPGPIARRERTQAARRLHEVDLVPLLAGGDLPAGLAHWDVGTRAAALTSIQRAIGNRASASLLEPGGSATGGPGAARAAGSAVSTLAGPAASSAATIEAAADVHPGLAVVGAVRSDAAEPPGGAQRIRNEVPDKPAAGYTSLPAPKPPELEIGKPECREGVWVAPVKPTSVGHDTTVSLYPGPGLHHLDPGPTGQKRHLDVTDDASAVVRAGEEEHLSDLEWARHLSYDAAADAVNAVAAKGGPSASSADAARQAAEAAVRDSLPVQLRWPAGGDPVARWIGVYSKLAAVTRERDGNRWHDMRRPAVLDPAEKEKLGVPVEDELTRYLDGSQIGKHLPEPLVRGRFAELLEKG